MDLLIFILKDLSDDVATYIFLPIIIGLTIWYFKTPKDE